MFRSPTMVNNQQYAMANLYICQQRPLCGPFPEQLGWAGICFHFSSWKKYESMFVPHLQLQDLCACCISTSRTTLKAHFSSVQDTVHTDQQLPDSIFNVVSEFPKSNHLPNIQDFHVIFSVTFLADNTSNTVHINIQ